MAYRRLLWGLRNWLVPASGVITCSEEDVGGLNTCGYALRWTLEKAISGGMNCSNVVPAGGSNAFTGTALAGRRRGHDAEALEQRRAVHQDNGQLPLQGGTFLPGFVKRHELHCSERRAHNIKDADPITRSQTVRTYVQVHRSCLTDTLSLPCWCIFLVARHLDVVHMSLSPCRGRLCRPHFGHP